MSSCVVRAQVFKAPAPGFSSLGSASAGPRTFGKGGVYRLQSCAISSESRPANSGLQPEGPCSERTDDRGYTPAFCRQPAKRHWMPAHCGCRVEVTQLSSSLSRIAGFEGLHIAREQTYFEPIA